MKKLAAASLVGLFLLTGCSASVDKDNPISADIVFTNPVVEPSPVSNINSTNDVQFINDVFNQVLTKALNVDYAKKVNESYVSLTTFDVFNEAQKENNDAYQNATKLLYESEDGKAITSILHVDNLEEKMISMTFKPETQNLVGSGQLTYTLANLGLTNILYSTYDLSKAMTYEELRFEVPKEATTNTNNETLIINMSKVKVKSKDKDVTLDVLKKNPTNIEFIKINNQWKINANKGIDILIAEIEQNIENLKKSKK